MANMFKSILNYIFGTNNKLKKECKMETMTIATENKIEKKTEEKKDYRFKIDWKKWKADVDSTLAERAEKRSKTDKKNWSMLDYYYDRRLTKLYSIRAQARGRLHRTHARLNWSEWRELPTSKKNPINYDTFTASSGAIRIPLTLEDQAAYIGDDWLDYAA